MCDRLPVHVNDDVKKFASEKRIHIIPIMPGSSHWFQVHDQIPLADLKKKIILEKNRFSGLPVLTSRDCRDFMRGLFTVVWILNSFWIHLNKWDCGPGNRIALDTCVKFIVHPLLRSS